MQIKFNIPDSNAPGFLRRQKRALEFQQKFKPENMSPELVDDIIDFLADFVTEPVKMEDRKEALLDATQEQFEQLIKSIIGQSEISPQA